MIRLPEGVTVERSERDGVLHVRARVLTEGQQAQLIGQFQGDLEFLRDAMEVEVLRQVADGLAILRTTILKALDR